MSDSKISSESVAGEKFNYETAIKKAKFYFGKAREFYGQNKKICDLSMSLFCFCAVMFGWADLAIISKLYMFGLMYMTAKAIRNVYVRFGVKAEDAVQPGGAAAAGVKDTNEVGQSLTSYIERLDRKGLNECMEQFIILGNNWMIYAGSLLCDMLFVGLNWIFSGFFFSGLFTVMRFCCYMYFCDFFVRTLSAVGGESESLSMADWTATEAAHNKSMPSPTRYLTTWLIMNKLIAPFCCSNVNIEILKLISKGSTNVVDTLTEFWKQFSMKNPAISQLPTAAGNFAVKTSKGFFKSASDKISSWRKKE
ncbi:MAG: hypothetical protein Hyperionvirus30_5 [Hyperionvirus sp.]|uniref:Uncharacterized protein n=1 Tax=Hyperionvirus sp. TaxID=2487770 RepID=A0A3G5AGR3_9VIRU|nr:MAG: hypothetical protein Hyperionvirus30_5 [Hyperionvirus sp.]